MKLYMVDYPRKNDVFASAAPIDVEYDYHRFVSCPSCGERVSGALWKTPREVVLTSHRVPDFLYNYCDNCAFLVSEEALKKITDAGLKGIVIAERIEKIKFQRKARLETPVPTFYHIELARSRITVNHEKSNIVYGIPSNKPICSLCNPTDLSYNFFRMLVLNTDEYEGYDIFQTYEMGDQIFLSQKFVNFCKEQHLTNLHYSNTEIHGRWATAYFLDGDENA